MRSVALLCGAVVAAAVGRAGADRCASPETSLRAIPVALAAADIVADVEIKKVEAGIATAVVHDVLRGSGPASGEPIAIVAGPECAGDQLLHVDRRFVVFLFASDKAGRFALVERYSSVHAAERRRDVERWLQADDWTYERSPWKPHAAGVAARLVAEAATTQRKPSAMSWSLIVRNTHDKPIALGQPACTIELASPKKRVASARGLRTRRPLPASLAPGERIVLELATIGTAARGEHALSATCARLIPNSAPVTTAPVSLVL